MNSVSAPAPCPYTVSGREVGSRGDLQSCVSMIAGRNPTSLVIYPPLVIYKLPSKAYDIVCSVYYFKVSCLCRGRGWGYGEWGECTQLIQQFGPTRCPASSGKLHRKCRFRSSASYLGNGNAETHMTCAVSFYL